MRTLFVILSSVLKNKQGPDRKTDNLTYSGLNCRGKSLNLYFANNNSIQF